MDVQVKEIEIYHYKFPVKNKKFPCANHVLNGTIYFKVFTTNEIIGYGEPSSYFLDYKIISKLVYKYLYPNLKNKNIFEINLSQIKKKFLNKKNYFIISNLIAGLDQAIWDIKSKISKKNLSNYISNYNKIDRKIGLYASGGMIFNNQNTNVILKEALKFQSIGFKGYKFRPPIPRNKLSHSDRMKNPPPIDIKKLVKLCEKLRINLKEDFKLMLDLGCRINNFKDFYFLSDCLSELKFLFVEEPLKRNINNYKIIHNKSKTKISFGESIADKKDFIKWSNYVDIFQPDTNMITITELLELKKVFKKLKKTVVFHNWANPINMLFNFHLSSVFNSKLIEYNVTYNPAISLFLKEKFNIKNGFILINNKEGSGVNFNQNFVNKYSKKI